MRIVNQQVFKQGISLIQQQQQAVNTIQQQLASGKKLLTPSDDPIASAQIVLMRQQVAASQRFNENATMAQSNLEIQEGVLTSVTSVLQRVRELVITGSNTILSGSDRASIVSELKTRLDELSGLANTQSADGSYLFSGFQSRTKPFVQDTTGAFVYRGDSGQRSAEVSPGVTLAMSDSGERLFQRIPSGNGKFTVSDLNCNNSGTGVVKSAEIINPSTYTPDTYTVSFVTNGDGKLAYQVVGTNSGQLIPALPAVIPANAPEFVSGQSFNFNGISMTIEGIPVAGDNFEVKPSGGQSIFNSVDGIIKALEGVVDNPSGRATMSNQLNQHLQSLDQGLSRVINVRSEIGARLNTIDSSIEVNDNFILNSKATLSSLEDLDYAEAAANLSQQMAGLQAAQQSYIKIQNLSLFNYL